ncbi:unnamed protein product, partial [Staurois parvus]
VLVIGIPLLTSCHADSSGDIYTDHQGTDQCPDDQCSPISATCQCPLMSPVSANQCTSMPHISANQCHISMPTSAHKCHISVPI